MVSCVALFAVVPMSPTLVVADLELGVFFALAISSLGTIGVLTAGWSSANKYSLMGGLRARVHVWRGTKDQYEVSFS